jgi:outer membrane biosynthesis protein TonB
VTSSYYLPGRNALQTRTPSYRCKASGTVVVNIDADITGAVVSTSIDEAKSAQNECLRNESLHYAALWKFNYSNEGNKKQSGYITFTFVGQ